MLTRFTHTFSKHKLLFLSFLFFFLFSGIVSVFADENTGGYNPAESTNPTCAPNSAFCFVKTLVGLTSTDNTFLGIDAGNDTMTGINNIFIGESSGVSNTSGSNNIFLGMSAGMLNDTGSDNTFTGAGAGGPNTSGSSNAFYGNVAGGDNTTGSFNAFFGKQAGNNTTTGSNNVFLGYQAGNSNVSGSNNIAIGYGVDVLSATADNQLFIGNLITGDMSDLVIEIGDVYGTEKLTIFTIDDSTQDITANVVINSGTGEMAALDISLGGAQVVYRNGIGGNWGFQGDASSGGQTLIHADTTTWTWPQIDGAGVLTSDGFGNLSFSAGPDVGSALSVSVATTDPLPAVTYNNGVDGVGATLTADSNGEFSAQDDITLINGSRILVKDQVSVIENGIYIVTDIGSVGTPFILTRTTDSDTYLELNDQVVIPTQGTTQSNQIFGQTTQSPVIGTDDIVYSTITDTYVNQSITGTQVAGQIPVWTGNSKQLTRGTPDFTFDPATNTLSVIGRMALKSVAGENQFIGVDIGNTTLTGTNNIGIGKDSGNNLTTGSYNTLLGTLAGAELTDGGQNTFIGNEAGQYLTTNDQIAIGYQALRGSEFGGNSGAGNLAFGYQAGKSNTTGSSNNFMGYQAGTNNTTGTGNTMFGYQAGFSNTIGYSNTFFGSEAGYNNNIGGIGGVYNTFFGQRAGYSNTSGNGNIFFGPNTGEFNVAGSENSFIGNATGQNITGGSNNLLIGSFAGQDAGTPSNAVYIGKNAGETANAANNVIIGYFAGATLTTGGTNTIIGSGADTSAASTTDAIAIGYGAVAATDSIALGSGVIAATNEFIIGEATDSPIESTVINGAATTCTITTGTGIACSSDERLKTNIEDISDALDKLLHVRTVTYNWNDKPDTNPQIGFLAQDLEQYFPELVATNDKGFKSVYYSQITPVIVEAIRELDLKIEGVQNLTDETFLSNIRDWFASAANGIGHFFADRVQTKELCVEDVCVTRDQFLQIIENSGQESSGGGSSGGDENNGGGDDVGDDIPPPDDGSDDTGDGGGDAGDDGSDGGDATISDTPPADEPGDEGNSEPDPIPDLTPVE